MKSREYISIPQLAKMMGISRIAVYKKVKKGEIKAVRIGRNYAIDRNSISDVSGKTLNERTRKQIDKAVHKTIEEYGDVLKRLGRE